MRMCSSFSLILWFFFLSQSTQQFVKCHSNANFYKPHLILETFYLFLSVFNVIILFVHKRRIVLITCVIVPVILFFNVKHFVSISVIILVGLHLNEVHVRSCVMIVALAFDVAQLVQLHIFAALFIDRSSLVSVVKQDEECLGAWHFSASVTIRFSYQSKQPCV